MHERSAAKSGTTVAPQMARELAVVADAGGQRVPGSTSWTRSFAAPNRTSGRWRRRRLACFPRS